MNKARVTHAGRTLACLFFSVIVMFGCGGSEGDPVAFPDEASGTGGAVFFDNDGDGQPGSGDRPVQGANVVPLAATAADGDMSFALDVNTATTQTGPDGSFQLDFRVVHDQPAVEISIPSPLDGGEGVGYLDVRQLVEGDTRANAIALSFEPRPCDPDADGDSGEVSCGTVVLPDLTPITQWEEIAPGVRERLELVNRSDGAQGLLPTETWFVANEEGRQRLRFSSVTANIGLGPLDIIAEPGDADAEATATWQRIWTDRWTYQDVSSGTFVFHPGHDHVHFDAFERYRLIDTEGTVVAESSKVSFCLRDSVRVSDDPIPSVGIFSSGTDCGASQQAINPGFADHYGQLLPDQWIDITGVEAGEYTVEIMVDPQNLIREADETNNAARFPVVIE